MTGLACARCWVQHKTGVGEKTILSYRRKCGHLWRERAQQPHAQASWGAVPAIPGPCSLPSPNHHCRSVSSVSVPSVHGEARSYVSPWFSWSSLTSCPPGCLCCLSLGQSLKSTLSLAHVTRKYNGVNSSEAILMQWEARKLADSCFCLWFFGQTLCRLPQDPKQSKAAVAVDSSITQLGLTALLNPNSLGLHSCNLQRQVCVSDPDFWITKA